MKVALFWLPAVGGEEMTRSLNAFLGSHRILELVKHFSPGGAGLPAGWSVWVAHDEGPQNPGRTSAGGPKGKPDYRELLDAETFRVFSGLRKWRKATAAAAATELYLVASNEQLVEVAQRRLVTLDGLRSVSGFGDGKVEQFGNALIEEMVRLLAESGGVAGAVNDTSGASNADPASGGLGRAG